jgi:hypothetical protein
MFEASRSGNRLKDADILWHPQVVTDCKMQFFCCFQKQQQFVRCMCMYNVSPGSLVRLSCTSIYYIHCWEMMNSMGFFSHGSSYCYSWWMWWGFDTFRVTLTRRLWVLTMLMIMIVLWVFQSVMVVVKSLIYIYIDCMYSKRRWEIGLNISLNTLNCVFFAYADMYICIGVLLLVLVLVSNIWCALLIDQEEKQVLCTCMVEVEHV